jgi:DNA-binding transcriptional LysR family regulator
MLDLRRLRVLREVAIQGSFSAAATELTFSPSAVSQQIAQLEREVGVALVERRSTGVVLTPAGEVLLGHANAILARAADAEQELRQLSDGIAGPLRIGAFASATAALMPDAVVEFRAALPQVEIELVEHDRHECLDQLARGDLDLAIVVRAPGPDPEGTVVMPLMNDFIDVLLPRDHRLAASDSLTLEQLKDEPWADCSGSPVQQHMGAAGIEPTIVFHSDHHRVVEGVVAAGIAIALVPRLAQPVTREDVVVRRLAPAPLVRPVGIAVRDADHQPAAVTSMLEIIRRVAAGRVRREQLEQLVRA